MNDDCFSFVIPVLVSGFAENETSPQVTLHPGGVSSVSPGGPGRSGHPDSHRQALLLVCYTGNNSHSNTFITELKSLNYYCFFPKQIQLECISLVGVELSSPDGDCDV